MNRRIVVWMALLAGAGSAAAQRADGREGVVRFMEKAGLEGYLNAAVEIGRSEAGVLEIADSGTFVVQYMIVGPQAAAEPEVIVDAGVEIGAADKIVVVTHGWIDRASSRWPADIAAALAEKTDPNEWVCAVFDWQGGAAVINPADAAKYGRDIGGPRLAAGISALGRRFRHVHLIGHSAGSWTIRSAATRLCETTAPETLHLTYLDAYVPPQWKAEELTQAAGDSQTEWFAEHYYTRDITLKYTQYNLPGALNVDITDIDPWFKEHEFPYRWYFASITGRYARFDEKKSDLVASQGGVTYGFARSLEAGADNWRKSLNMEKGGPAVRLRPAKAPFGLDFLRK